MRNIITDLACMFFVPQDMEERKIEEERALKRGKPLSVEEKPKTKTLPFWFEDGKYCLVSIA